MKLILAIILISGIVGLWCNPSQAQNSISQDSSSVLKYNPEEIINLPVQNTLGNLEITSASKQAERIFQAPLTSTVITQEDLIKSGVTSIPEAMRLVPGAIVRQTTNGNYDIHLRGLDFILPYTFTVNSLSKTILVMIDGRPVYNHLNGGTFWETLPIDIHDVQQIEVVKGPVASLYGSNAVSGVINIITRKLQENRIQSNINTQYGSFNSFITNSSIAYRLNSQCDLIFSGNFHQRGRTSNQYYNNETKTFVDQDSISSQGQLVPTELLFPNPNIALRKFGFNAFAHYHPNAQVNMRLSAGLENSEVQKIFFNLNPTPLQSAESNSKYIDVDMNTFGLHTKLSYLSGTQEQSILGIEAYDFSVFDGLIEYNIPVGENLQITPSIFARRALYQESEEMGNGLLNNAEKSVLNNYATGLKVDYKPWKKLRLIGAIRAERFNFPNDFYIAYQGILNYQANEKQHLRLIYGKSNGGAYVFSTFVNLSFPFPLEGVPGFTMAQINVVGNKNLDLLVQEAFELGYRAKINKWIELDVALFRSCTENFDGFVTTQVNPFEPPLLQTDIEVLNTPTIAEQIGGTLSLNMQGEQFQFKPFITFQNTQLKNFSPYLNTPAVDPVLNLNNNHTIKHRTTPDYYGGFIFNYHPIQQLNINVNSYFFAQHNLFSVDEVGGFESGTDGAEVKARFMLNAKVGYNLYRRFTIFANVRNLFNNNFEHYFTDQMKASYLFGFNLKW